MPRLLQGIGVGLILLLTSPSGLTKKIEQFGCTFEDKYFNLPLKFPAKAQFGELNPAHVMKFKDKNGFSNFMEKVRKTYIGYMKDGPTFNSLSNYLRFYETYKKRRNSSTTFAQFYKIYNEKFGNEDEPGGNIMSLMQTLAKQVPKISQSSYFVTRSQSLNEEQIRSFNPLVERLPKFFEHDQVAAAIAFNIEALYKGRGWIILDPQIGSPFPFVVMEGDYKVIGNPIQYHMLGGYSMKNAQSQYIAAKNVGGGHSSLTYLYYFRKPYCSLVETTLKPNFLKFHHSMVKLNNKGEISAQVTAHVEPSTLDGVDNIYNVEIKITNEMKVKIKYCFSFDLDIQIYKNELIAVCEKFKLKRLTGYSPMLPSDCMDFWAQKLKLLQEMFRDRKFFSECQSTLKLLDNA